MSEDDLTTAEASVIVGLDDNTLRAYMKHGGRKPFLASELRGHTRLINRAVLLAWHEAYKAAPKLGRRGDGSVRWKGRKRK